MGYTLEEMTEKVLEPLYLVVSGAELDRIRAGLSLTEEQIQESIKEGTDQVFFSMLAEEYSVMFSSKVEGVHETLRSELNQRTLNSMRAKVSSLHEIMCFIALMTAMEGDENSHRTQASLDLLSYAMLKFYEEEKKEIIPENFNGRMLVLMHFRYRQIDKAIKSFFLAYWRRRK